MTSARMSRYDEFRTTYDQESAFYDGIHPAITTIDTGLRFYLPNIFIGTDTQTPQRTVDPTELASMFIEDGSMDFLLSKTDVFGVTASFMNESTHTTAGDQMVQRSIPMLAARGVKFGIMTGGPLGYATRTGLFVSGLSTPTEQGQQCATFDLSSVGNIGYLEALGATIDWIILDSPLDRVTMNGSNKARHTAHHGFGTTADKNAITYTATAAGSAGNSDTVAHVQSGTGTTLSVTATTTKVLADNFGRTETDAWGNPGTGAAWVLTGTAANFDVDGSVGTISVPAAGVLRRASNALTGSTANQRARCIFSLDAVPVGNQVTFSLCLRQTDVNNYYEFRCTLRTDASLQAGIYKTVAGVTTRLDETGSIFGLTDTAAKQWYMQATSIGTLHTLTVWAVGTAKPSTANSSIIDSTFTTGGVSVLAGTNTGVTSLPAIFSVDQLIVYDVDGDGTSVVVNLATNGGGTATSSASAVVAAVNADFDASGIVIASLGTGTGNDGSGVATVFAATNLAFGDDGVNLSNTDTATAIVAYMATVIAARPATLFGFTVDIRHPYDGVTGYSAQSYPTNQMPDFKLFWPIFWSQAVAAGISDNVKLVMWDSTWESDNGYIDTTGTVAHAVDWRGRFSAIRRQIEADGVAFVANRGESANGFPPLDDHNFVGPASEQTYHDHVLQMIRDDSVYRQAHASDLDPLQHFLFLDFGYYPRVQLPVSNVLSQARTYLMALGAHDRDDFDYMVEGPTMRQITPSTDDPVGFRIRIEKPDEVLASGLFQAGALYRWERSTDDGVTWTEMGTGAVVSTIRRYLVYDLAAATGYKYRARLSKATVYFSTDYSDYGPVVTL